MGSIAEKSTGEIVPDPNEKASAAGDENKSSVLFHEQNSLRALPHGL